MTYVGTFYKNEDRNINEYRFLKWKTTWCPECLTSLVPFDVGDRNPYNLRNANNIQLIHSRTTLYYNSFLPSSIRLWNDLPSDIRNNASINSFKTYLNRNTLPANPLFFYGDRKSQILHTRLRLKCSSLNNHLFLKNIVDSPNCVCGENETNHHYLFECPLYNHIRLTLFDKLRQIPSSVCLQTLLFGDHSQSLSDNKRVFEAVHSFIIASKRFN